MQMQLNSLSGIARSGLDDLASDVTALSANALEPNFTLMPQWMQPLVNNCSAREDVHPVHAMTDDGRLGAFSMMQVRKWRWGLPVSHAESFMGDFPISGTPLLSCVDPAGSCAAMLSNAFETLDVPVLMLPHLTGHQVVSSVLVEACRAIGAPIKFFEDRKRASLHCNGDYAAWLETTFSRKRRKEFRRLKTRLAETGSLRMDYEAPQGAALDTWIDEFLKLEQAGWKGHHGTAIGQSDNLSAFLKESMARFARSQKLMCWRMSLDDTPVAMMFGTREGSNCWIVKIAYDETLARFSPGVLLVLEATRSLFEDDTIMFVDSCAAPNHPMIDHLWKDRLCVRDVMIGNPARSRAAFQVFAHLETMRNTSLTSLKKILKRGKGS